MKPGITTTEFWVTALTVVISAVVSLGALFGLDLNKDHLLALVPTIAPLAAAIAALAYSHSRAKVKAAASTAAPAVVSHGVVNVQTGVSPVD